MFQRFTDRARRVVIFAQDEARGLNHNWIGTEHLLLAVLREGQGVGAKALEAMQISLEATRQQVESIIGEELGDRLTAMAARLAAIERKLGEAGAEG